MALHCVWSTDSFKDALLKCANLRGDSDSVAAVAGQIAGMGGVGGVEAWRGEGVEGPRDVCWKRAGRCAEV
jgi:ADP-ribosylglycohydrolase